MIANCRRPFHIMDLVASHCSPFAYLTAGLDAAAITATINRNLLTDFRHHITVGS